jgi:hypothetical protein
MAQKAPEKHPRIPGQKNPRDTAAKKFWKDNYRFTSLFNLSSRMFGCLRLLTVSTI